MVYCQTREKEITVEGLEATIPIDPFEGLEIKYTGISPFCEVVFDTSKCSETIKKSVDFECLKKKYKIGDEIVVTAKIQEAKTRQNGYIVEKEKNTYILANTSAPYYLESCENLDIK